MVIRKKEKLVLTVAHDNESTPITIAQIATADRSPWILFISLRCLVSVKF